MTKKYNVEELNKLTADELKTLCKENGLPCYKGKSKLNKGEMIENLSNVTVETTNENVTEKEIVEEKSDVVENVVEKKEIDVEGFFHTKNKEKYIEEAEVGTLVAFVDENGKPRTAAIQNRSSKRKVLKVVTEFGWEFIVPYEKVLWIKKGNRWPNGVYRLLKEYKNGKQKTIEQ